MDLKQIESFVRVAELGSFSRAALEALAARKGAMRRDDVSS